MQAPLSRNVVSPLLSLAEAERSRLEFGSLFSISNALTAYTEDAWPLGQMRGIPRR